MLQCVVFDKWFSIVVERHENDGSGCVSNETTPLRNGDSWFSNHNSRWGWNGFAPTRPITITPATEPVQCLSSPSTSPINGSFHSSFGFTNIGASRSQAVARMCQGMSRSSISETGSYTLHTSNLNPKLWNFVQLQVIPDEIRGKRADSGLILQLQ